jgi:hypothetical protein
MFQHKPEWYEPAVLSEAGIQRARGDATTLVGTISDQMVTGRTFEVALSDCRVNEWLTALPTSLPELRRSFARGISEPAIRFDPGRLRLGALWQSGGWRAILSLSLCVDVSEDGESIDVTLARAQGGSLPLPRRTVDKLVSRLLRDVSARAEVHASLYDLRCGVQLRNRFVWGNGDRPFRLERIKIGSGELRLRIEPL